MAISGISSRVDGRLEAAKPREGPYRYHARNKNVQIPSTQCPTTPKGIVSNCFSHSSGKMLLACSSNKHIYTTRILCSYPVSQLSTCGEQVSVAGSKGTTISKLNSDRSPGSVASHREERWVSSKQCDTRCLNHCSNISGISDLGRKSALLCAQAACSRPSDPTERSCRSIAEEIS